MTVLLYETRTIAGLAEHANIAPHSLRHWCATNLHRHGWDLESLRLFLGHSSLQTTSIYLHSGEERLRQLSNLGGVPAPTQPLVSQSRSAPKETPRALSLPEQRSRRVQLRRG